jgi:hypothetical protein
MTMRKKHLRTAAKRRRKVYNHPSPWKRKKCDKDRQRRGD